MKYSLHVAVFDSDGAVSRSMLGGGRQALRKRPMPGSEFECVPLVRAPPTLDLRFVDRAYRQAARKRHPDKGGTPEAFRKVKGARDNISAKSTISYCAIRGYSFTHLSSSFSVLYSPPILQDLRFASICIFCPCVEIYSSQMFPCKITRDLAITTSRERQGGR